jgi:ribosome-binding factor A
MARRRSGARNYPRTARLKELFREILAEELERIDDERLDLVTVIEVDVDSSLDRAVMYFVAPHDPDDPDADALDAEVLEGLADHRGQLRRALGQQARVKRVPELVFEVDRVMDGAHRIEDILRELPELHGGGTEDTVAAEDAEVAAADDADDAEVAAADGIDEPEA